MVSEFVLYPTGIFIYMYMCTYKHLYTYAHTQTNTQIQTHKHIVSTDVILLSNIFSLKFSVFVDKELVDNISWIYVRVCKVLTYL